MDRLKLEYEYKKKGYTMESFAEAAEMSKSAFYRKLTGKSEFTRSEIKKIVGLLDLDSPVDIFFADEVS